MPRDAWVTLEVYELLDLPRALELELGFVVLVSTSAVTLRWTADAGSLVERRCISQAADEVGACVKSRRLDQRSETNLRNTRQL